MLQCPTCGRLFASDVRECPEDGTLLQADVTTASDMPVDPLKGRVLDGKYRLDERLGEGGMGTVYRATHLLIDRPVAVKVLNSRLVTDEAARERFRREARAAGRLQHSNAVAVTDFGETGDGLVYLVMELLEGRSLREVLARDAPLDPARAVSLMLQASAAVAAAHEAGIIHRDLKPGNIFVVQRPNAPHIVKVLDFGIAKLGADTPDNPHNTLTGAGVMIGTPRYMSPEQCDGAPLTPASDVYSLGVILYEMLTGQTPFTGATPLALALKHSAESPRPPRDVLPSVPPALEQFVLRALEKRADARQPDAGAFRRELYAVAERLGLEHSAGFSAPTIETLRDAGVETPSGRLVIDIERLRQSRAAAQTSEAAIGDTAEEEAAAQTGGRPAPQPAPAPSTSTPPQPAARPATTPQPATPANDAATPAAPSENLSNGRAPRQVVPLRSVARSWGETLRQPPIIVLLVLAALVLLAGATVLWQSRAGRRAAGGVASPGGEREEAVGRSLSDADAAPRTGSLVRQPRTAAEFYENATYYFTERNYTAAIRDFRRALELQPDFPSAHNRLGRSLLMTGQFPAAAEEFRAAIRQRGGNYPTAQYNLGFALQLQGDGENAVKAYRTAIENRDGNYPDAFYQIGVIYLGTPGRTVDAAEALRTAVEQSGGRDLDAQLKLGAALIEQKDYAGAEEIFRKALDNRGGDLPYAHYNLGLIYQLTDRPDEAAREYETYLQQAPPGDENRRKVESLLRDLRRRAARPSGTQP